MKRISLHIGLNQIDPDVYGPGNELVNCLNDCDAYTKLPGTTRLLLLYLKTVKLLAPG
jgi:hypothetical protein